MNTDLVKGFRDITGIEADKRVFILEVIRQTFSKYSYDQIETPVVEYEEFVKGENPNDEAISDIFKLRDKGNRKLALRYEFTFQLKRVAQNKKLPYKRFQIGPVFRDEPVSANRLRQFTQCDIDVVGSSIKEEAEVLAITKEILDSLKIKSKIYINNRKLLNEILDELKVNKKEEVLREIDKLDKLPEKEIKENLRKLGAEKILEVIKNKEDFFKKYKYFGEIEKLKKYCKCYGFDVFFTPYLVRGLSYYNGSVFEIKSELKESICAGGSYLVNGNQSTGISLGVERLETVAQIGVMENKVLVVSLDEDQKAINLAQRLRKAGRYVTVFYGKPSKALEYANAYKIREVIFVGAKEVKQKKFQIKDMKTGKTRVLVIEKRIIKKNF